MHSLLPEYLKQCVWCDQQQKRSCELNFLKDAVILCDLYVATILLLKLQYKKYKKENDDDHDRRKVRCGVCMCVNFI